MLFFSTTSYRSQINRRLALSKDTTDRESVLIELRRERGLTSGGNYQLGLIAFNRLMLQSGLTMGLSRFFIIVGTVSVVAFGLTMIFRGDIVEAFGVFLFSSTLLPFFALRFLRSRRQKKFAAQFPDSLDIIVRSLRAGHPVPIAVNMVGREMGDPIGSEFGIVTDEVTYGADLEAAMRNLYARIGSDDLPLFVTAVAIQGSTGGNLGEILREPFRRHPRPLQDAAQDSRAGRRGTRLGDDPVGAADRHVHRHPVHRARLLRRRSGTST